MTTDTLPDSGTRTITYGVIGCGMMGQEHLRNIALLDNTAVGAIFEPDAKMRAQASQLAPDAQFVDSIEALLDIPEVDCLLIASPNFRHVEHCRRSPFRTPCPFLSKSPCSPILPMSRRLMRSRRAIRLRFGSRWNIATCPPSQNSSKRSRPSPEGSRC